MPVSIVLRAAVVLLVDGAVLLLLSELLPGFTLDGAGAALATAALVGVLNALVWPLLARFALPLSVLTLGLGALALNALLVVFAIDVVPGASVDGFGSGVVVTLGMAALTALLSALLAIDEDESWYRNVVRRQARRRSDRVETDVPGVIFLEIDGLALDVLRRALRDGSAPAMARWLREGSHRLAGWETDWSSQTGACQAGLLHGDNHDMPAFRWWEKDRGAPIVTNHPRDAAELERRHSDGRGLLHGDGASRANILSGDAVHSMLTMSTVLSRRRPIGRDYSAYFARPYAVAKTLTAVLAEIARERHAQAQQRRRDVQPRIHRSREYAVLR
ncbi:MAG: phage holin family protein, partial [Thermoleophilaceae bacterium]